MVISKIAYFWKAHDTRNLKNNVNICTERLHGFYFHVKLSTSDKGLFRCFLTLSDL